MPTAANARLPAQQQWRVLVAFSQLEGIREGCDQSGDVKLGSKFAIIKQVKIRVILTFFLEIL